MINDDYNDDDDDYNDDDDDDNNDDDDDDNNDDDDDDAARENIRAGEGVPRESVRECQVPLNTRHKHLRHTAKNTTREFKTHWKHCNVPTSTH